MTQLLCESCFQAEPSRLKRVVPGRPDSSLLYFRVLAPTHPLPIDLSPVMPEGRAPLAAGQVEYLLQWSAAGAPRRGEVADAALLADKTAQAQAAFWPQSTDEMGIIFGYTY